MKKIKIQITKNDGTSQEVEGEGVNEHYGIYKREDKMYALTHLSSGLLVASSRLKKNLQLLASQPEFFEPLDLTNKEQVSRLSAVVQKHFEQYGWK